MLKVNLGSLVPHDPCASIKVVWKHKKIHMKDMFQSKVMVEDFEKEIV